MKRKNALWLALLLCVAGSSSAADVKITISGRVVAKACTINTVNADVPLGNLSTSSLTAAGSASPWHTVNLDLTNCPIGTSQVSATFSGTADASGLYFKNAGGAENLALQLADDTGKNIPSGGKLTQGVNDATQSATFALQVRAISPAGNTTQGTIQSTIDVTYTWL